MKYRYALAVCALALAAAGSARASLVTDTISFSDTGTYGVGGASWNGTAVAAGSFNITFDPTQLYLTQGIAGVISDLSYSVTDSRFAPANLTLDPITSFAYDGAGSLTLYSDPALGKNLTGTPDIAIGINGWAYGPASDVWYSQNGFSDTLTTSGSVSISPSLSQSPFRPLTSVPLPGGLSLFATGLIGLGALLGYRKARHKVA